MAWIFLKNYAMRKRLSLPSLRDILFLAIFSIILAYGPRMLNLDGDLPRHILVGKIIIESGKIPTIDIFSHVLQGQQMILHEWLADVIFWGFYSFLGLNGIVLLAGLLLATTFTLSYNYVTTINGLKISSILLIVCGAAASSLHWITRPHLFSMFFLAISLIWADKLQRNQSKNVWLLPTIMLLWCNIHGEFIAGFLVLGAYCGGWVWDFIFNHEAVSLDVGKRLGLTTLLSFFTSLVNPIGVRNWGTVLNYFGNRYLMSHINETRPPDFTNPRFFILLGLIAFSLFLSSKSKERLSTAQAFLLAGFSVLSLLSARNIHFYGVVVPLSLAAYLKGSMDLKPLKRLESIIQKNEPRFGGILWPVISVLVISSLTIGGFLGKNNLFSPTTFPVEAVNWLEKHPQSGNMFNDFDWGGYILYRMWPTHLAFIDSQTDLHGDITREYEKVITLADDWQSILDKYAVTWAIISTESRLTDELRLHDDWHAVYEDSTAIIFQRE